MFGHQNSRCENCKHSYYNSNGISYSILPPVLRCGVFDSEVKSGECKYFEARYDNDFRWFGNFNITQNKIESN